MGAPANDRDQQAAARQAAVQARTVRADIKQQLKARTLSLAELFAALDGGSDDDLALANMRVIEVLQSMPGIGPTKAARLMGQFAIAANRRLQGLGSRQRAELLAFFEKR